MSPTRSPVEDAARWELRLRIRLRGSSLIAEMGLDEGLRDELRLQVTALGRWGRDADRIGGAFPALLACYLVAEGAFSYTEGGNYWSGVCEPLGGESSNISGHRFEDALSFLCLERFEHLTAPGVAYARVGKILAHGGIPVYCLKNFFALVVSDVRRGIGDAAEMLSVWRESSWRLASIAKPTQRFLLNGSDLAIDFLGRCIDLVHERSATGKVPSPEAAGLPDYVVAALAELPPGNNPRGEARGPRVPQPSVTLDPWSPLGPVLELPPAPPNERCQSWLIEDGASLVRRDASSLTTERVPLAPARAWECEFSVSDGHRRRFVFEGLSQLPALLFDPATGRLVRGATTIALGAVWVVALSGTKLTAERRGHDPSPARITEELPPLTGRWSGYTAREVDLTDVQALRVSHDGIEHAVRIHRRARPELVGEEVDGVTTTAGTPVLSRAPVLRLPAQGGRGWQGRLRHARGVVALEPADLAAQRIDLAAILPAGVVTAELVVRGPLGSDLRTNFCVVPGLTIERPRRLLTRDDGEVPVVISADGIAFTPDTPVVAAEADRVVVAACRPGGDAVDLVVRIPRLRWGLASPTSPVARLDSEQIPLEVAELSDGIPTILEVRTGLPSARLRLRLRGGRAAEAVAQTDRVEAARGRWTFDLDTFGDSVKASSEQFMVVVLDAEACSVPVCRVAREHQVWGLEATHAAWDGALGHAEFRFSENQAFNGRSLRLWSRWRPWDGPLVASIDDGTTGFASISSPRLSPGDYLAEVSVEDDLWVTPTRPATPGRGVAGVRLGDQHERAEHLGLLNPHDPLDAIAAARADGQRLPGARGIHPGRSNELVLATLDAIVALGSRGAMSAPLASLVDLMTESPCDSLRAMADLAASGRARPQELCRLGLRILGRLRAEALEPLEDDAMRTLWSSAALVAVAVDLPAAVAGDEAANQRCDRALGWSPLAEEDPPAVGAVNPEMFAFESLLHKPSPRRGRLPLAIRVVRAERQNPG